MSKEIAAYRDNLEDLLSFFGGKRILSVQDVCRYTGRDHRWVKSRFQMTAKNGISVPTLARKLAEG